MIRKARTVDVIWFNEREMPCSFYEVEHTTDIKNSLSKFFELQDFHATFFIVADLSRKAEFEDKLNASIFSDIRSRVQFLSYDRVVSVYEGMNRLSASTW